LLEGFREGLRDGFRVGAGLAVTTVNEATATVCAGGALDERVFQLVLLLIALSSVALVPDVTLPPYARLILMLVGFVKAT